MYSLKIMHDAVAFKGTLAVPQIMHAAFIVFASKSGTWKRLNLNNFCQQTWRIKLRVCIRLE